MHPPPKYIHLEQCIYQEILSLPDHADTESRNQQIYSIYEVCPTETECKIPHGFPKIDLNPGHLIKDCLKLRWVNEQAPPKKVMAKAMVIVETLVTENTDHHLNVP